MSRATCFNCGLENYCRENNIVFVDVWDQFYSRSQLYARDGVHLSREGTSVGNVNRTGQTSGRESTKNEVSSGVNYTR